MGMGINAQLDVPQKFEGAGLGGSNTPGCPPRTWCVKNAGGGYRGPMNVTDALAQSPNTAFAKLIQQVGVPRAVDMAVQLGMRSYAEPGSARAYDPNNNGSIADYVKQQNLGSFTLGPLELNALELSNVAATLASGGMWCPPNPIDKVFDRHGREVPSRRRSVNKWFPRGWPTRWPTHWARTTPAEQRPVRPVPWAGACRCRARPAPPSLIGRRHSWVSPTSTPPRTTSSTTLPNPPDLCSFPLRRCANGNLYGGNEPARTWYLAMEPIADDFGPVAMPPTDPRYVTGSGRRVPSVTGLKFDAARKRLQDAGFQVADKPTPINSYSRRAPSSAPRRRTSVPGFLITINTSNGIAPAPCITRRRRTHRRRHRHPGGTAATATAPGCQRHQYPWAAADNLAAAAAASAAEILAAASTAAAGSRRPPDRRCRSATPRPAAALILAASCARPAEPHQTVPLVSCAASPPRGSVSGRRPHLCRSPSTRSHSVRA